MLASVFNTEIAASPVITGWRSTGGHPAYKDNDRDLMYSVRPEEPITFEVKVDRKAEYEWTVNKLIQSNHSPAFTWTVPEEKGIYEIHVTVRDNEGEAHHEWVVSTLSAEEAPDLFEYFADGQFKDRQGTDPWGRPLREWTVEESYKAPGIMRGWMEPPKGPLYETISDRERAELNGRGRFALRTTSETAYGTWRFWFRFPRGYFIPPNGGSGPRTQLYYEFLGGPTGHAFRYNKVSDSHNYFYARYYPTMAWNPLGDEDSGFKQRKGWYGVTIVRTKAGWFYAYITDVERGETYLQFRGYNPDGVDSEYARMTLDQPLWDIFPDVTVHVDGLEIYREKYLFPSRSAQYRRYIADWQWTPDPVADPSEAYTEKDWKDFQMPELTEKQLDRINGRMHGYEVNAKRIEGWKTRELRWMQGKRHYNPVYGEGIVVQGRGMTLKNVAKRVNDPSLLRFDAQKQAWICTTDLVVDEGAELIIRDTTLRMHGKKPGERRISVMYGATLRVERSTITSDTEHYFLWRFTGTANYSYNLGMSTGGLNALSYGSFGSFLVEDATIDNCAYLFLDSPRELRLKNVRFTNLHQADAGEYSAPPESEIQQRKEFVRGEKAFCVFLKNYDVFRFDLNGLRFAGARTPVDLTFMLNSEKNRLNVYNSDFGEENVVVRPSIKMMSFWNTTWPEYYRSRLGLVNCRFRNLTAATERTSAVPKYYLDVQVMDSEGKPVSGAKVTVINEVDAEYPAENLSEERPMAPLDPGAERTNVHNLYQGFPLESALTGADGHTPPPSDRAHTLILADYVLDQAGKKAFSYTIKVATSAGKKIITGVRPGPLSYRPEPRKPAHTGRIVSGDGPEGMTEEELKR